MPSSENAPARRRRPNKRLVIGIGALFVLATGIPLGIALRHSGGPGAEHGTAGTATQLSSLPRGAYYGAPNDQRDGAAASRSAPSGAAQPSGSSSGAPAALPQGIVGQAAYIKQAGQVSITLGKSIGSVSAAISQIGQFAVGAGGYASATSISQSNGAPTTGNITVNVPVAAFQSVLYQVKRMGKVTYQNTNAQDVSGQVYDLNSRIQALQDSLAQYERIMTGAQSIGDILNVQNQIDTIQSQIEQLQGQSRLLDAETTYSSLAVALSLPVPPAGPAPKEVPETAMASAWHATVHGFLAGVDWLVSIVGPLLFVLLFAILLGALARLAWWAWRRKYPFTPARQG